ncbi:MAG: MBL fold metallo-hydrolase [Candidatus Micrarchaeota archaeon]|nr:MBL fold metallo-hydrolase [Candidatus Micrarchaeota archaeon]MDE1848317.1 MBL fold metallo-hydrolase [Candidatus Micrarchaeota archaeon]MDE1864543.1 MBL fold metallo-hydrolase [Candidatus Micrarchaeota archaeon]
MKIKFYGAAGEVGRSCILIESNGTKVLLDCGIKLGKQEQYPVIEDSEFKTIDAIVLSHAHLDHCGYLPHVFSTGWNGYIYTTKPTFELVNVLLSDYLKISNPKNVTKEGFSKVNKHYKIVDYNHEFAIKALRFKLLPAGHVLGSSLVEAWDNRHRIIYTGDMSLKKTRLLDPAQTDNLHDDTLIIESTNAGEKDELQDDQVTISKLLASVKETINKGGKVVIPSFAVGRAQEVLFILDDYMKSGVIPKVPIYIDGMISKANRIYRHNVIFCRKELQQRILMSEDDPFKSVNFHNVMTKQMRSKIMSEHESCIIVTTSGMISGGPILKYLERLAGDSKNKLLFVGYQADGTMGRTIVEGAREIELNGRKVQIKMGVEMHRLSGHADKQQLARFISKINGLKNVFIVHGEGQKGKHMQETLEKKYKVHLPVLGQEFELN